MSGYSKRMMAIAAAWLDANPSVGADLRLPRHLEKLQHKINEDLAHVDDLIVKARARGLYEAVAGFEESRASFESIAKNSELHESLNDLSNHVNRPYQLSQTKLDRFSKGEDDPLWFAGEAPWLLAWARDGYNVFDLSPDFVAAMLLTDPSEIDLLSLQLPFRGMLFMIPGDFARGAEGSSYTKIHIAEIDDSRSLAIGDMIEDKKRPALAIYATDGIKILSTVVAREDLSWSTLEELPDDVTLDDDKEARKTIQRVVLGALAYVTAVDGALTQRFPAPVKKKARGDEPRIAHWAIGRTIKIDPELVRTARSGSREVALRLKHRHIVRGHYRNQAHGPKHSARRRQWIAPFWRGPEEGARLVHTYKPEIGDS